MAWTFSPPSRPPPDFHLRSPESFVCPTLGNSGSVISLGSELLGPELRRICLYLQHQDQCLACSSAPWVNQLSKCIDEKGNKGTGCLSALSRASRVAQANVIELDMVSRVGSRQGEAEGGDGGDMVSSGGPGQGTGTVRQAVQRTEGSGDSAGRAERESSQRADRAVGYTSLRSAAVGQQEQEGWDCWEPTGGRQDPSPRSGNFINLRPADKYES